ncbi:TraE/TraK family type IV conjugative transfer system protein, partial [Escherichia coli]|uniref:TraE/TraK family type IV conjugative transfer system protein n=2 Tax=Enterobacteriaceae TaxID=543 RepID=UPI0033159831
TYIPMGLDASFTLSRNRTDASYLEQTAESLTLLRYNVSPESVKANHQALLRFFDSETRPTMQDVLAEEAQRVIDNNVTSAFYLSGLDTNPS